MLVITLRGRFQQEQRTVNDDGIATYVTIGKIPTLALR